MKRRDFLRKTTALAAGVGMLPALACSPPARASLFGDEPFFEQTDVFVSGAGGYPEYRIPSVVVTRQGTVLAFCEARQTLSDHAENDIVLRRSTDGGKTWKPLQAVFEDGPNVLVNPCAVVLESGRILMMFQRFPHGYHARAIGDQIKMLTPGIEGDTISTTVVVHSDDDGQTWSAPHDVTAGTKRPAPIISTAAGPGIGIVLRRGAHKGRIIIPTNEGWWEDETRVFNVYACYSDDQGQTWRYGDPAPNGSKGFGNEVQMVELSDGSVMLNTRSNAGTRHRKVAVSNDGGQTWTALQDVPTMIESQCQGTIFRYTDPLDGQKSRLLFANPASQEKRVNGTVRLSYDEGQTWPVAKTVYDGSYAYSCLTSLPDGTIGLLYERDDYKKITFARFNLAWLTDGKDSL